MTETPSTTHRIVSITRKPGALVWTQVSNCSCGWQSRVFDTATDADIAGERHVKEES